MYRNLDYYKDIHILAKLFSLVFYIFGIFLMQNPLFLFLLVTCLFVIFRNYYTFIAFLFFFVLSFWYPVFIIFAKFFAILFFVFVNLSTIHFQDIREFIECFSYHKKQSKVSYLILYICYFCKYYTIYFQEFFSFRKSYGKHITPSFLKYVVVQSFDKTKVQINSLMKTYKYRFYNFSNKRSYVEKNGIAALDLKYILLFTILFLLIYLWGR